MKCMNSIFFCLSMTISINSFSQLNMQQMIDIRLGETFKQSAPQIKKMFSQKSTIMKADFLGASKITYKNIPFDFYGNADYTFQYIKDTLVAIEVDFNFFSSELYKFKRLYSTLMDDISKDESKKPKKDFFNLNYKHILQEVKSECNKNSTTSGKNYKPINVKSLGSNYWDLYSNSSFSNKFLRISVSIGESTSEGNIMTGAGKYYGCTVHNLLKIGSYDLLNLQSQLEKFPSSYTEVPDE